MADKGTMNKHGGLIDSRVRVDSWNAVGIRVVEGCVRVVWWAVSWLRRCAVVVAVCMCVCGQRRCRWQRHRTAPHRGDSLPQPVWPVRNAVAYVIASCSRAPRYQELGRQLASLSLFVCRSLCATAHQHLAIARNRKTTSFRWRTGVIECN